jgi:hypothetical protein
MREQEAEGQQTQKQLEDQDGRSPMTIGYDVPARER